MQFPLLVVRVLTVASLTAIIYGASPRPAAASVISIEPSLPVLGVPYTSLVGAGCFPLAAVCISAGSLELTSVVLSEFTASGQHIVTTAEFAGLLTTTAGTPIGAVNLSGILEQEVLGRTFATQLGSWTTNLVALSLTGPVLGNTLTVGLDPTHVSSGVSSILPVLGDDSLFRIDSFFDVFVQVDLDSVPPLHTTRGPVRFEASATTVPEPASGALLALGAAAFLAARRRRAAGRQLSRTS
jgi:hypothetical protein